MLKLLKIYLFAFFIFLPLAFWGQNKEMKFRNPNFLLSDNSTNTIIEDFKGFMWFGTEGGLNKYDGTNNTIYLKESNDSRSLSNNKVLCLYETKNKELWIGTASGLNLYNRNSNNFTRYYYKQDAKYSANLNAIKQIIEDDDGDLWLATQGGVCFVDRKKQRLVSFNKHTNSKYASTNVKDNLLNSVIIKEKNIIVSGSTEGRIFSYDKKKGTIKELFLNNGGKDNLSIENITWLSLTNNGTIWISTANRGLIRIKKIEEQHIWYDLYLHDPSDNTSISANASSRICDFRKDEILIGTSNGGLNKFNYKTNTFEAFKVNPTNANSIDGNSIWSVYKDSKNRIWLGLFNVGINIIDSLPQKFTSYKHSVSNKKSLIHSSISSFLEDSLGNMWITSDGGGLDYWNRKTDNFTHFKHNPNNSKSLLSNAALCLCRRKNGEMWIGSFNGGIDVMKNGETKFKHITTKDGLSNNNIFAIEECRTGEIYIACYGEGLNVYNPKNKNIKEYLNSRSDSTSLAENGVNTLFIDSKDRLWIGFNESGLDLMKKENDKITFIHYINNPKKKNSISDNTVLAIFEDEKGHIWLGTRDGLNKFDTKTNIFTVYRKQDGLPSNIIVGILEDDNNMLWISTLNGLSMFNPQTETFENYTINDGLQGEKFSNRASFYRNVHGEFFFGGNDGFTTFHPSKIKYDYSLPNLYLVSFKLFNGEVVIGKNNSPLKKHISQTKELTLKHSQSVFTLEYVALNFKASKKIKYAYILEGLEEKWNYVGDKRTATYTTLDAGDYLFKVKSTNTEGIWNTKEVILKITVLPVWWKAWWFRLSIGAFVILLLYVAYIIKTQTLIRQKHTLKTKVDEKTKKLNEANVDLKKINVEVVRQKEKIEITANELSEHKNNLERKVKKRTIELEKAKEKAEESDRLKTAFLTNMSHEIRTPMNAIIGFSQLLNSYDLTEEDRREYIDIISENTDSLLVLIENILNISIIEANEISIKKETFEINLLLTEVLSKYLALTNEKEIDFRINNKEENNNIIVNSDRKKFKQILVNLFDNAYKFTEKGFIELGFEITNNKLQFYIKDTGIGISKQEADFIFDRFRKADANKTKLFRGAGLGLTISKKTAQILGGDLRVESKLGKGSIFYFTLSDNLIPD